MKYEDETQYRYIVATDLSWRHLDIVQVYTLRWLIEVFFEDWKLYEGWGQLAKQSGEEGSSRGLILSLPLDSEKDAYRLDTKRDLRRGDIIGLELRSLLGTYFFVSHGVEIPTRDAETGHAPITRNEHGELFDWSFVVGDLVNIQSQTARPELDTARVAIKYRGSWFYIDDSDSNTKFTFLLIEQLAALLGGKVEKEGPLLTLPVSAP